MPLIDKKYAENLLRSAQPHEEGFTKQKSNENVFSKILRLVSVRERSVKELRDRFLREGFRESEIEASLNHALECGLVDDTRFAETLIVSRKKTGKGRKGIEYDLEQNGINVNAIPGWPEKFFPSEECELNDAIAFLYAKPPKAKNKREAAYRKLVLKGYSSSIAGRAVRQWLEENAN